MARHRRSGTIISGAGRHARPGKAAHAAAVAGGGIAASAIMAGSAAAQAQPAQLPVTASHAASTAVLQVTDDTVRADVIVVSGDTLSGISQAHCGTARDWTGIYQENEKVIGGNYNLILPGQKLVMSCRAVQLAQTAAVTAQDSRSGAEQAEPASQPAPQGNVSTAGMGAFQSCVIRAESGGNPQIWNPSGHWGLYQFSYGTWIAHGGSPGDFGRAGAAEQTRIFWNAVSVDGGSDWSPYDGCPF